MSAWDPSLGKNKNKGDYSAVIVLARDTRDGKLYVIAETIARMDLNEAIATILHYAKQYPLRRVGVEKVQCQEVMADQLKEASMKQGLYFPVEYLASTGDKYRRIESLQLLTKDGSIEFDENHKMLLDQMQQFPKGRYDDGPDALEMAVRTAREGSQQVRVWHSGMTRRGANGDWLRDYRRNLWSRRGW